MAKLGIDVAVTQLGVKEATGQNDGIPAERYNKGDKLPWCAAFALYCNANSDEQLAAETLKDWYLERAVQTFEDHAKAKGWWYAPEKFPQRGDYIFFGTRGASDKATAAAGRHMGIVEKVVVVNVPTPYVVLTTIEGNLGNQVARVVHSLADPTTKARITGFARIPVR